MDQRKPAVSILIAQPLNGETVEHVTWGLEEEGIPYEIEALDSEAAEVMAKQAADRSRLNVGIGISGPEEKAVLHHRDLPMEKPLFTLGLDGPRLRAHLRTLGGNAARLVKGEPLVFDDGSLSDPDGTSSPGSSSSGADEIAEIIAKIVMELLNSK
jgi:hypothetical protein